ncbi:RDD family protein [Amycolatopsis sp. CA-230715]|uniref:RDD family protein n=1 Tax=Amycolatopsis sp. CA-230715 TaxID=2745196 RepID=UPI001C022C20|nr:RDD family protein [Amycolatopsis sp. CA-230715]
MAVRRRDVKRLREYGPPSNFHGWGKHGEDGDPRYPSPRGWRVGVGFLIDLLLHAGGGAGAALAVAKVPRFEQFSGNAIPIGIGAFVVLSLVHRIFVQWAVTTTLGKALCGLRLVRDDTGGRPTLWRLTKDWLLGVFMMLAVFSN